MNELFYIVVNGQQKGPFSVEELKTNGIQRNSLVWTEGYDNWTKAENIATLKEVFKGMPPPIPQTENINYNRHQTPPPLPNSVFSADYSTKYHGYELASKTDRFKGAILETLILAVPLLIIHVIITGFDGNYSPADFVLNIIISAVLGAIFYPSWSGNIGHKLIGLKVISSVDGSDMSKASQGAWREVSKCVLSVVLLPAIWILWDDDNQNLYDKVAKSYVVKKK